MSWIEFDENYRAKWLNNIVPRSYYEPHFKYIPSQIISLIYSYLSTQYSIICFSRQSFDKYARFCIEKHKYNLNSAMFNQANSFSARINSNGNEGTMDPPLPDAKSYWRFVTEPDTCAFENYEMNKLIRRRRQHIPGGNQSESQIKPLSPGAPNSVRIGRLSQIGWKHQVSFGEYLTQLNDQSSSVHEQMIDFVPFRVDDETLFKIKSKYDESYKVLLNKRNEYSFERSDEFKSMTQDEKEDKLRQICKNMAYNKENEHFISIFKSKGLEQSYRRRSDYTIRVFRLSKNDDVSPRLAEEKLKWKRGHAVDRREKGINLRENERRDSIWTFDYAQRKGLKNPNDRLSKDAFFCKLFQMNNNGCFGVILSGKKQKKQEETDSYGRGRGRGRFRGGGGGYGVRSRGGRGRSRGAPKNVDKKNKSTGGCLTVIYEMKTDICRREDDLIYKLQDGNDEEAYESRYGHRDEIEGRTLDLACTNAGVLNTKLSSIFWNSCIKNIGTFNSMQEYNRRVNKYWENECILSKDNNLLNNVRNEIANNNAKRKTKIKNKIQMENDSNDLKKMANYIGITMSDFTNVKQLSNTSNDNNNNNKNKNKNKNNNGSKGKHKKGNNGSIFIPLKIFQFVKAVKKQSRMGFRSRGYNSDDNENNDDVKIDAPKRLQDSSDLDAQIIVGMTRNFRKQGLPPKMMSHNEIFAQKKQNKNDKFDRYDRTQAVLSRMEDSVDNNNNNNNDNDDDDTLVETAGNKNNSKNRRRRKRGRRKQQQGKPQQQENDPKAKEKEKDTEKEKEKEKEKKTDKDDTNEQKKHSDRQDQGQKQKQKQKKNEKNNTKTKKNKKKNKNRFSKCVFSMFFYDFLSQICFMTFDKLNIGKFVSCISNDDTMYIIGKNGIKNQRHGSQEFNIFEAKFDYNRKYDIIGLNMKLLQNIRLGKRSIINKISPYYCRNSNTFGFYIFYEYCISSYRLTRRRRAHTCSYHTGNGLVKFDWDRSKQCFIKTMDIGSIEASDDRIDSYQYFARNEMKKGKKKVRRDTERMSKNQISRHLTFQNMQLVPRNWDHSMFEVFEQPTYARGYIDNGWY